MLKVLSLVLLVGFSFNSFADSTSTNFVIPPHLYFLKDKPVLSWIPGQDENAGPSTLEAIDFKSKDGSIVTVMAKDRLVYLPSLCGWGSEYRFSFHGADDWKKIENVPCPGSPQGLRMAFLSDTQTEPAKAGIIGNAIAQYHPNLILHAGDHVDVGGNDSQWAAYFEAMKNAYSGSLLIGVAGNHEYYPKGTHAENYEKYFHTPAKDAFFAVKSGEVKIIVLNSNYVAEPDVLTREKTWLETELAKNDSRWTIAIFHHPPFSSGIMGSKRAPGKMWPISRAEFVPLFEKYKVNLVLAGHVHLYEHRLKNGVHYLNAGPAGGTFRARGLPVGYFNNPFTPDIAMKPGQRTWTRFEVTHDSISVVTENIKGRILETFTIKAPQHPIP